MTMKPRSTAAAAAAAAATKLKTGILHAAFELHPRRRVEIASLISSLSRIHVIYTGRLVSFIFIFNFLFQKKKIKKKLFSQRQTVGVDCEQHKSHLLTKSKIPNA
ncbi:hypothetical protein QBC42DRAFT_267337 [Cladorrhinum samala]|uniref:Uncharacterized protein n=1 Tax=Cladorrhinum samala TaxID=585594 RepID=A0AAV9HPF9_9PEZI|nr:hypothetical protein QBC42DRAFT_267337 [Cladorrhinum samala]